MASEFLNYIKSLPRAVETGLADLAADLLDSSQPLSIQEEAARINAAAELAGLRRGLPESGGSLKPARWTHLADVLQKVYVQQAALSLAGSLFAQSGQEPTEIGLVPPADLEQIHRLTGDLAEVYAEAGLLNKAQPDHKADMPAFVKSLIEALKNDLPREKYDTLKKAPFKTGKGTGVKDWPTDLYKLYLAVTELPKEQQVIVARKILNYTQAYFGLDYENYRQDIHANELNPFDFKRFTFDVFVNGAVKTGHITRDQTLKDLDDMLKAGSLVLTPQGEELLKILSEMYFINQPLVAVFNSFQDLKIERDPEAPKDLPVLVGDGLSGEQGAHYLASEQVRHHDVVAPDMSRDASMVTAALRYLTLKEAQKDYSPSFPWEQMNLIRAGQFYVGAADVAEPLSFARTVEPYLGSKALYFSMAYAFNATPVVLGGTLAAAALKDKVQGIVRLQSPTTMHPKKNDVMVKQGMNYLFAQWLKDLSALVEAEDGKQTALPVWPIVRTFSVEQEDLFRRLMDYVNARPKYGITFASPQQAGRDIGRAVEALMAHMAEDPGNEGKSVVTFDASQGLRTHRHSTQRIVAFPYVRETVMKWFGLGQPKPQKASVKKSQRLNDGEIGVGSVRHLKKAIKKSSGFLAASLGPNGAQTLMDKGVDLKHELEKHAHGLKANFDLAVGDLTTGSFPLMMLEGIRRKNPGPAQYYFTRTPEGELREVGLFEKRSGGRVGFRLNAERSVEMFISPPPGHPGREIVIPYRYNKGRVEGATHSPSFTNAFPEQVSNDIVGKTFVVPLDRERLRRYTSGAWMNLGLITHESMTTPAQVLVGDILGILSRPELGFDLSNLTIDSLDFSGIASEGSLAMAKPSFTIDRLFAGEKRKAGESKGQMGQVIEGRIRMGGDVNVTARLFIKGNKSEGEPEVVTVPQPLKLKPNGIYLPLTMMGKELWQKFVELGGDPNPIHTVDLAGTATQARGSFAPGFGIATLLETALRRKFSGSLVDNLKINFHERMGPGMSYEVWANPITRETPDFEYQIVKTDKARKNTKVVADGRFTLKLKEEVILHRRRQRAVRQAASAGNRMVGGAHSVGLPLSSWSPTLAGGAAMRF